MVASSTVPFAVIELTRNDPPVAGDAGNTTAINYFTAPISLTSYNANQKVLQSKEFNKNTSDIFDALYRLAPTATLKDSRGQPIRVLSAYEYATQKLPNPYQSFAAYLGEVQKTGQATKIQNSSAWNQPPPTPTGVYTNYDFQFTFTANVVANGSAHDVALTDGKVTVTTITYTDNRPSKPMVSTVAQNLSATLDGSNDTLLNQLSYGQTINDAVSFNDTGTDGWSALKAYIDTNIPGQNGFATLQSLIIGEITGGFLFGFINSDEIPRGQTTKIKDMPSQQWWSLSPTDGYAAAQPNNTYYDPYAAIICKYSGNQVYGAAYGDRFTNPDQNPTIQSSFYNTTIPVASWQATLLPPITNCSIPSE